MVSDIGASLDEYLATPSSVRSSIRTCGLRSHHEAVGLTAKEGIYSVMLRDTYFAFVLAR